MKACVVLDEADDGSLWLWSTIKLQHDNRTEQGKYMQDTIDLLEAIGRDASLRHASSEALTRMLEQADASAALTAAVASGDRSHLSQELGAAPNQAPQITQAPGHEEDEEEEEKPAEQKVPAGSSTSH